jgi:hypothetical protein
MTSLTSSKKSYLAQLALLLATQAQNVNAGPLARGGAIALPKKIDDCNKAALPESFLSYSFEFAFFPDFAGKTSVPALYCYSQTYLGCKAMPPTQMISARISSPV